MDGTAAHRALGLAPGASTDAIRKTYRRLARRYHPDAGGDPEAFRVLHAAYEAALAVAPPARPRHPFWVPAPETSVRSSARPTLSFRDELRLAMGL
jgi:hypothetical protein